MKKYFLISVILLMFQYAYAGTLSTNFASVVLDGLQIGENYNVGKLSGVQFNLMNKSDQLLPIRVEVVFPNPEDLKKGYEPVPDLSWITVQQTDFVIQPGQNIIQDVTIAIPYDKKFLGKKYQAYLYSYSASGSAISIGLKSRIQFNISPQATEQISIAQKKDLKTKQQPNFIILPNTVYLENIETGKPVDIKKISDLELKIINPADTDCFFEIRNSYVKKTFFELESGYEDIPDVSYISFSADTFFIPADAIKKINIFIKFPDDEKLKSKKYMSIIHIKQINENSIVEGYTKVLIKTK